MKILTVGELEIINVEIDYISYQLDNYLNIDENIERLTELENILEKSWKLSRIRESGLRLVS